MKQKTKEGYLEAVMIMEMKLNSELSLRKQLEAKKQGKDPYDVWAIERTMQIDTQKAQYRYTNRKIVDCAGIPIVTYEDPSQWADIPTSPAAKVLRNDAAISGQLINTAHGHKTGSVIVLKTEHVVLSSLKPATIKARIHQKNRPKGGPPWKTGQRT